MAKMNFLVLLVVFLADLGAGMDIFSIPRHNGYNSDHIVPRQSKDIRPRWWPKQKAKVSTSYGTVQGLNYVSKKRNRASVFLGIPYAQPPVGNLRFHDPLPAKNWTGTLKATSMGPACWQNSSTSTYHPDWISEDCLYLNVFAPDDSRTNMSNNTLHPVLFYIHGGGWEYDAPRMFPVDDIVDNLVSRGVIVVMPAYRLNIFGFFHGDSRNYTGNYGYKDLILALQWTSKEIAHFGGDKQRVTVMGHSSGATAVGHLSLSPLTDGLFQRGIQLSGIGTGDLSFNYDPTAFEKTADRICYGWRNHGGIESDVRCLRRKSAEDVGNTYLGLGQMNSLPTIDGPGGLFPDTLTNLHKKRRAIPMFIGTTGNEFPMFKRSEPPPTPIQVESICKALSTTFASTEMSRACSFFYNVDLKSKLPSKQYNDSLKQMFSDAFFYSNTFAEATSVRDSGAKTYLYSFDYVKKEQSEYAPYHVIELTYIFGLHRFPFNQEDLKMQKIYLDILAAFIHTGSPTSDWQPLTSPTGFNYYSISLKPENREFYHFYPVQFWNRKLPYLEAAAMKRKKSMSHEEAEGTDVDYKLPITAAFVTDFQKFATNSEPQTTNLIHQKASHNFDASSKDKKSENLEESRSIEPVAALGTLLIQQSDVAAIPALSKTTREKKSLSPFTVIGWSIFAITMYGFAALAVSFVVFVHGKSRRQAMAINDQTPLIYHSSDYRTFVD